MILMNSFCWGMPSAVVTEAPAYIPQPVHQQTSTEQPGYDMSSGLQVGTLLTQTEKGKELLAALRVAGLEVQEVKGPGDVELVLKPFQEKERYELSITPHKIIVTLDNDAGGLYHAAQTLTQSVVKASDARPALPTMELKDYPMLPWRGFMLDCARTPHSMAQIKQVLRLMARYKLNRFHWHLTDDQGWRIEIKRYPKLTEIGSYRAESPEFGTADQGNGIPVSGFYTQDDIREIVDYAHARGIIVIPEIEVPGHATAAIASYPELGNHDVPGFPPAVATTYGVLPWVFAPKESTFTFLDNVMEEVCALFPRATHIHTGGDEAPRDQWIQSASATRFMEEHKMPHHGCIQHYFTQRLAEMLSQRGRGIIGWDEIQDAPILPPNLLVTVWRDNKFTAKLMKRGIDVIVCTNSHFYFDHSQGKEPDDPCYFGQCGPDTKDWQHVYSFDPTIPELNKLPYGLQANAWGETNCSGPKLQYMIVPRICALAEVAWRPAHLRSHEHFLPRLLKQYPFFDSECINFRQENGAPRRGIPRRRKD